MKAVLLIAINFAREQRWPILTLLLWVLLLAFLGLVTDIQKQREDLLFVFKQDAVYVLAFSVFFGGSAIYNERRSRRILGVLSKAVGRQQYLSGLVLGVTIACAVYCFALGMTGSWTLGGAGFPIARVWFLMVCLVAACTLAGTVACTFSTFLNPFFAAARMRRWCWSFRLWPATPSWNRSRATQTGNRGKLDPPSMQLLVSILLQRSPGLLDFQLLVETLRPSG